MSRPGVVPELSLRVPALPENVIVVRELLRGLDPLLSGRPGLSEAVQTAVSEAANNVVMHAYHGAAGPLQVDVMLTDGLEVRVRDWGVGFADPVSPPDEGTGFGRAVIAAFADRVDVGSVPGQGSVVAMSWAVPPLLATSEGDDETDVATALPGDTVLTLRPQPALAAAAGRVVAALGSRAPLTVDRLGDLQLIGDALVAHAGPLLVGTRLSLVFLRRQRALQLSAGPFRAGRAEIARRAGLVEGAGLIDRLASKVEILTDPRTGQELLVLTVGV